MRSRIARGAEITYFAIGTFAGGGTMGAAFFIRVINTNPAEPMIRRVRTPMRERRGRFYRIFRRYHRRTPRFPRRNQALARHVRGSRIHLRNNFDEIEPASGFCIAIGIGEAFFALGESLAFFVFSGAAILSCGAVGVVPFEAAEKSVFGAVVPRDGVGGIGIVVCQ